MSKINAVRLININYNNNAIQISDECFHFNRESTLISLQNGGGKSVLIQMLTAPFVHKKYRNVKDRPFAGYFTSVRPSFILVEWTLDNGTDHVMTGMMVRKNQKTEDSSDDELEMINIIAEYKGQCAYDIYHLPVVEKSEGNVTLQTFAACRQMFDSYKKDRSAHFFCYDMNNGTQSKAYFDKLLEYGINCKEWETIIRKVNEEESGLSKLFSNCRDERGLIETWFLPTIEDKLNHDKNRMQEFRTLLERFVNSWYANQSKFKQKDAIERFDGTAALIAEQADSLSASEKKQLEKADEIASFLQYIDSLKLQTEDRIQTEE